MPPERTNSAASLIRFPGAPVGAHLYDALGALGRFHHFAAFDDGQAERLLDIDILTGVAGIDEHRGMPVVGRGDDHGVDVFVFEELLVLFVPVSAWHGIF